MIQFHGSFSLLYFFSPSLYFIHAPLPPYPPLQVPSVSYTLCCSSEPLRISKLCTVFTGALCLSSEKRVAVMTSEGRILIWDVEFEHLAPRRLLVGGRRAEDLALRLKYASVAPAVGDIEVHPGIDPALDAALGWEPRRLVVLATYTAMLDLRAVCARRGWVDPYWRAAA